MQKNYRSKRYSYYIVECLRGNEFSDEPINKFREQIFESKINEERLGDRRNIF